MAGFDQQLQGGQATARPIVEGQGEDVNLKGVAAGIGLASSLIGSNYAASQMDKQFKDVVADYREATAQLAPAENKLNVVSDAYQKTGDPLLLREMTTLNDTIRKIKLGEDNGKFSGLSAKARTESAYKTSINKFPKYARELRAHKDAATGTGLLKEAIEGGELMMKQATQSTKLLTDAMSKAGYNINSTQERVRFMAERRVRFDRDARLKDLEQGYKAIMTPLEAAQDYRKLKNAPRDEAIDYKTKALTLLSKELGIDKAKIDMSDYGYRKKLDLIMKELKLKSDTIKYGITKETAGDVISKSHTSASKGRRSDYVEGKTYKDKIVRSGYSTGVAKDNYDVSKATVEERKRAPGLKNQYTVINTKKSEQSYAHNNIVQPIAEAKAVESNATMIRKSKERGFSTGLGSEKTLQLSENLLDEAMSIMGATSNLNPKAKAEVIGRAGIYSVNKLTRFYNDQGMTPPQDQIAAIQRTSKQMQSFVEANDPVAVRKFQREQKNLQHELGTELWKYTVGKSGFQNLAKGLINLRTKLSGATGDEAEKIASEINSLEDQMKILSRPVADVMSELRADKEYSSKGTAATPTVALIHALSVAVYSGDVATNEETEEAVLSFDRLATNKGVAVDTLDTNGALNLARAHNQGKQTYIRVFDAAMLDAASYLSSEGSVAYSASDKSLVLSTGRGKSTKIPIEMFQKINYKDSDGTGTQNFNAMTAKRMGASDPMLLTKTLYNIAGSLRKGSDDIIGTSSSRVFKASENKRIGGTKETLGKTMARAADSFTRGRDGKNQLGGVLWKDGWSGKNSVAVETNWSKWRDRVSPVVEKVAGKDDFITPELMIRMMGAESMFKDDVINGTKTSVVGAIGISQFMKATIEGLGGTVEDAKDYTKAIPYMYKYLKKLQKRFGNNTEKVVAAYNAGEGSVNKYGGVPPFRETRKYVDKILGTKHYVKPKKRKKKK